MDFVVTNYKYFHPANFGIGFMYQWTKTSFQFRKVTHKKILKPPSRHFYYNPRTLTAMKWNDSTAWKDPLYLQHDKIMCKLVKFNKCYVKRILLFIVIDLNRKKWWSIDEVSTVWLELFTCSYSCTVERTILSTIWK